MCFALHPNLYERWDELCIDQVEYGGGRPEVGGVAWVPGARDTELTQVQHTVRLEVQSKQALVGAQKISICL